MEYQLNYLASLSYLDLQHDELKEEYGDLPAKVEELQAKVAKLTSIVNETDAIISSNGKFVKDAKITLVELKDKEEKLAKQQFSVRNNKEFDAITKEIEHIRIEFTRISDEMRSSGIKEENLRGMLESQKVELESANTELQESEAEFAAISSDQNADVKKILKVRSDVVKKLVPDSVLEYNRIRRYHDDAVVAIKRNSCTGCFSQVPPQKIVEIRNNLKTIYYCEQCGRILYPPDDIQIDPKVLKL